MTRSSVKIFPPRHEIMEIIPAGRRGYVEARRAMSGNISPNDLYDAITEVAAVRLDPPLPEDLHGIVSDMAAFDWPAFRYNSNHIAATLALAAVIDYASQPDAYPQPAK